MTAESVRDLGYLAWKDPFAWMENMRGKRWETLIRKEKQHFQDLSSQPIVQRTAKHMEKELVAVQQYIHSLPPYEIGNGAIHIHMTPTARFVWKWSWSRKKIPAYDIDVMGNIVWYVTSNEDKNYKNKVICEDSMGKHIWSKDAVSSQIAIIGERCYYIKVVDYFRTIELCVCDAQSGRHEKVLYREKNEENDLTLVKGVNRTLYLQSMNPMETRTWRIQEEELRPLYVNTQKQWPLGESIYGEDCVLTKNKEEEDWTPHGHPLVDWHLPSTKEGWIQWINLQSGHVITLHEGGNTLWWCSEKKKASPLFRTRVGTITPNVWAWDGVVIQSFMIKTPFTIPYMIRAIHRVVPIELSPPIIPHPIDFPSLEVHRFHAPSRDGTPVPFIMMMEKGCQPKAQFIYVYGAYGLSTPIHWPHQTWYPLLTRKWAIVFALVRGGGDVDAAWAEAARRENRHASVDDFEAVIRRSRQILRLGADKTVIYGRSAGGVPVGALVARYPEGNLVGAAFTEAPYVDVLRTSSNPDLPLTIGEFKEFGNPIEKIMNFKELMNVSPINSLPVTGAPGIFVMSHVGLLDQQVFAYESFKWVQRLRGVPYGEKEEVADPKGKYVTFETNEAHQYRPQRMPRFRAIDFAILDAWAEGTLRFSSDNSFFVPSGSSSLPSAASSSSSAARKK